MSENNSFKELEKLQEEEYSDRVDRVKNSIDSNLNGLSFFTNIIDVYFAKVISYFVNAGGGNEKE